MDGLVKRCACTVDAQSTLFLRISTSLSLSLTLPVLLVFGLHPFTALQMKQIKACGTHRDWL